LLEPAIASWSQHYSDHPAILSITKDILILSKQYNVRPQHIALCLPMTGHYNKASQAIRDGFLAAWFGSEEYHPTISIYSANALNILDVYSKAVENGADFIVGPLEKQAIASLVDKGNVTVTTLALNQHDLTIIEHTNSDIKAPIPPLIQFGLTPEDEVQQIAERAVFDGHNRALVITPNNDWWLRLYDTFRTHWELLGGVVLEHISYEPKAEDYSTPVKILLNINSSNYRAKLLRQKLNRNMKSESRMRQDADMIFMAAVPIAARQIVPQFRFHRADKLPIYSSSHVYTGSEDPQLDSDLNNVNFTDIPWILDSDWEVSLIQQSINRNWSAETSGLRRFYALGVDAFLIIPNIGQLTLKKTEAYSGATGELTMTKYGHIQRKLLWAKFIRGKPKTLDQESMY